MNQKKQTKLTIAVAAVGIALMAFPATAHAATPSELGAISRPTATVVNHAPYGKVYQLQGTVSGTKAGDWVRVLNAANQPASGFRAFQLGQPITTYTVYYNPGSMPGQYKVQIGGQTSAAVQLNVIPGAGQQAAVTATADARGGK